MKIISTICSKRKREELGLLPAEERYTGEHLVETREIAKKENLPFYILSGKYGLISNGKMIPYYDYYLEDKAVGALIKKVVNQMLKEKISEIDFYIENKDSWKPYIKVIKSASEQAQIKLNLKKFRTTII